MSMTLRTPTAARPAGDTMRGRARTAGILYLITFVSMPTLALYQGVRTHADFVLGTGSATGVLWGALSEVVVAIAGVGTAVVLFPIAKRQSEAAALGFVTSRVLEAGGILLGVVSVLSVITLRNNLAGTAGADRAALLTTGHTLSAVYDNAFLLSQSLAPVVNACCLGYVMYRSGLVPRILPTIGFIGVPLLLAADLAVLFGVLDRGAPINALAALPIALWEFSIGVYMTFKGFRPTSPLLTQPNADAGMPSQIPSPRARRAQPDGRGATVG
jgi:hypothetical protein